MMQGYRVDIGLGLIELKGTVEPWRKHVLYFYFSKFNQQ